MFPIKISGVHSIVNCVKRAWIRNRYNKQRQWSHSSDGSLMEAEHKLATSGSSQYPRPKELHESCGRYALSF
jgi:hypothetical protein